MLMVGFKQEGLEKEESHDEAAEQGAASGSGAGPSHRQPSIKFPIRRTSDGRRLSSLPFHEVRLQRPSRPICSWENYIYWTTSGLARHDSGGIPQGMALEETGL